MGLFDFLKPKKQEMPRSVALAFLFGTKQKHVQNLKAVGKNNEARAEANKFIADILQAYTQDKDNVDLLDLLAQFACAAGETEGAQLALESVVNDEKAKSRIDLTVVYAGLARVFHQRLDFKKELNAWVKAAAAVPPSGCKMPASTKKKAWIHTMAFVCAERIGDDEVADFHDKKRKELIPDFDWHDYESVIGLEDD